MPWQEVSIMAWRQEFVALATQEGANRWALWRHFGISPTMGYRWLRRYQAHGPAGLQERSRRPHRSPQRTATAIAQQVLQFRDAHPAWGGRKLRRLLQQQRVTPLPSASTITAILRRHDRRALSSVDPPRRPFALLSRSGGRCQRAPADGADTVDPDFRPRQVTPHHLDRQWPPLGYGHYAPAAYRTDRLAVALGGAGHPWAALPSPNPGQGRALSSHAAGRSLRDRTFPDLATGQAHFTDWRTVYNCDRPHEALGDRPPVSRYLPSPRPFPAELPPIEYAPGTVVRRVQAKGEIALHGPYYHVGRAFRGYPVAVQPTLEPHHVTIQFCHETIAELDLTQPDA